MVNMEEAKGKLMELGEKAKALFSKAASNTQKGARTASLKVKIVMEENKINRAMCELGKRAYELIEKDETNIAGNSQVKEIVKTIKSCKKSILDINEEIKAAK